MIVIADASCNILYASYYLDELITNKKYTFQFKSKPFVDLEHNNQYLALIVKTKTITKKIIVDFSNFDKIDQKALKWCDVYGKVNLNFNDLHLDKMIAIGPLTAINVFNKLQTFYFSLSNYLKSYKRIKNKKLFFSYYKGQLNRPALSEYIQKEVTKNYLFFASSLWKKEKELNDIRSNFITTCKEHSFINFEGGFAPRTKNDIKGYENLTMKTRIEKEDFLRKTLNSKFVFNAPSVGNCNGWRLVEYLAMGKVVLTTPIVRVMPGKFIENEHYILTNGSKEDFNTKIDLILSDKNLCSMLAKNARNYFVKELIPSQVLSKLLN
ncbi:glycosyltransferase [Wenyingzhuangia sp. IMCC45533]